MDKKRIFFDDGLNTTPKSRGVKAMVPYHVSMYGYSVRNTYLFEIKPNN
ncbi:hypothetical protein KKF86_04930 [bacterium]|nr:hypothetical protein [bacterium]